MQRSARMKKELEMLVTSPPYGISCWPKDDRTDLLEARKYIILTNAVNGKKHKMFKLIVKMSK